MPESAANAPRFLFVICQVGAEAACKAEVHQRHPELKFAFSRPGFLTFRVDSPVFDSTFNLIGTFVRTSGWSIGRVGGEGLEGRCEQLVHEIDRRRPDVVHLWPRDRAVPGDHHFEPLPSQHVAALVEQLRAVSARLGFSLPPINTVAAFRQRVLDVVLVDEELWWLGEHESLSLERRWPGGVPPIDLPSAMVSRAYLKMEEALQWSRLPLRRGEICLEIGAAPGGACQALLRRGARVLAVDPAPLDPRVAGDRQLQHFRGRARELRRSRLQRVSWLMADLNVAPNYTLQAVEELVLHGASSIRGLILTLKLMHGSLADCIPEYIERVKRWGFAYVRTRQLAFNRREFCLAALRDKAQRAETDLRAPAAAIDLESAEAVEEVAAGPPPAAANERAPPDTAMPATPEIPNTP